MKHLHFLTVLVFVLIINTPFAFALPNLEYVTAECSYSFTYPTLTATIKVTNTGSPASVYCHLDLYLSTDCTITPADIYISPAGIPGMPLGTSYTRTFNLDISSHPGTWHVGAILDSWFEVNESNENDNILCMTPAFTVPEDIDLKATEVEVINSTAPWINYHYTIGNDGTVSSGGPFDCGVYLSTNASWDPSDYKIYEHTILIMGGGGQFLEYYPWTEVTGVPPGEYYLFVVADCNFDIPESNENNNTDYDDVIKITVPASQPDLIVQIIEIIDSSGPDISYKITVKNIGSTPTTGDFKTRIYLSADATITAADHQINDWNCYDILNAGETKTSYDLTSTVTGLAAGEYYLGAITDAQAVITESNENNNTLANLVTKITITDGSGEGDDILDIPMAGTAPVIDGSMDDIWYSVANIPLEKQNVTDETAPDDWLDCFASFKMMFDANNFYFFIQAHDDNINTTNTESWANDSFDLFFDGDNSKNDQATGYDANDLQLRYMYGQTTENIGNAPNSACKFKNTDNGYNLEVQIPANDMTFNLEPDHTFGFEIQFNDNDTGSRDHMLKWWAASNDSWLDPSIFGTAKTTDYVADYPMYILQAQSAPTIDGEADEAAWEDIPWFSHNTFIYKENGGPFDPMPDLAQADGWNDCRFNCKLMWQGNMLYFFAQVFDDVIDTSHPDWYMNDAMDLQIDGNNDKGQTTDGNDYQYAFMYTATPSSDAAYTTNSSGWTVEAAMDMASDLGITPGVGHRMGLEVQNNDNDGGGRSLVGRWWSDDNITWSNPSLRGTIELADLIVVDVSEPGAKTAATAFHLAQNYPNPFNPSTTIQYRVPNSCHVTLMIYDLLGKKVTTLVNDTQTPGEYTALWNAQDQANGIYLIRMTAGDYIETKKLILQK